MQYYIVYYRYQDNLSHTAGETYTHNYIRGDHFTYWAFWNRKMRNNIPIECNKMKTQNCIPFYA